MASRERTPAFELVRLAVLEHLRALPAADLEPSDLTSHMPYCGEPGDDAFSYLG